MTNQPIQCESQPPVLEAYLLGLIEFEACLALQQRLVYEVGGRTNPPVSLLICEHTNVITVGRQGSRLHIHAAPQELHRRGVAVRWVNRGGPCLAHGPGQLAIYPIIDLESCGWTVGEYLNRFQSGLKRILEQLHVSTSTRPGHFGLWGRTGQLIAFGAAVKGRTTYHGAYFNVDPSSQLMRAVESDPIQHAVMTSLKVERQHPTKISQIRSLVVPHLAAAFNCEHFHVYTHHPLFRGVSHRVTPGRRVG